MTILTPSVIPITVFTARRSYASAVLGVLILSVRPSVRPSVHLSVCPSHACFVTKPKKLPAIFLLKIKKLLSLSNVV